jgi:hypothetical protein
MELAQVNIGQLAAPLDSAQLADFVALLDPVNAIADAAPGFVWRLQTEDGNALAVGGFESDAGTHGVIVNMSVWRCVEDLAAYTYASDHRAVLRRRREWFTLLRGASHALWWVPTNHRPTVAEAEHRLAHLRTHGPTPYAFTLRQPYAPDTDPIPDSWHCPA